jgi:hypothetical protein
MSHIELAKYLGIPEATFRRWRKKLSPSTGDDRVRTVCRNGKPYEMKVSGIGRHEAAQAHIRPKGLREIREGLLSMKANASVDARFLLNTFMNWVFGPVAEKDCLQALENILSRRSDTHD